MGLLKTTGISTLILLIYLCIGSVIFWSIEHEIEIQKEKYVIETYTTIENEACIPFTDFQGLLKLAWTLPPTFSPNSNVSAPWQWNFVGSFFFSFVVVSTIGFGNQAPSTKQGQVAVMIFSIVGIPIYLNLVYHLSKVGRKLMKTLQDKFPKKIKKFSFLIISSFTLIFFVTIFLIPAFLLTYMEAWTFRESLYFCFISLSTIGFGDYVAGVNDHDWVKLFLIFWMAIGMVYVTTCMAYFQLLMEKFAHYLSQKKIVSKPVIKTIQIAPNRKPIKQRIKTPIVRRVN